MTDTLNPGQALLQGDSITSNNGAYSLTLQDDGNLVLAVWGNPVWATATDGQDVRRAEMQMDGNFVLYSSDKPVWETNTDGKPNVRLVLQDDRNLVAYSNESAIWAAMTNTDEPPPPQPAPEPAPEEAELAAAQAPAPEPPPPPPPPPAPRTYTVVSGDTLWAISERFYGDGNRYQQIADASGIPDPDKIFPGQVLTIPE